ncbi:MAG: benzoylformate decarboxylase [Candidatus Tectimicrobiota bacterium]|nr:MAG: benzoylformate decarboxylase [Candidatus Tectomicrobia bacterium]
MIIAHVMGGSYQLAGQLYNAQMAGSALLVIAGDWTSEAQDYRVLAPFPGLSQAEAMRPLTKEARCAYQVDSDPAAIPWAVARGLREATTPPTGPVYVSIHAELLNRDGLQAQVGEAAGYRVEPLPPARPQTVEAVARRLGAARCPVLVFGDDVWREGAQAEAVRLAELLAAPVFSTWQVFANFPTRHPLYCGRYPVPDEFTSLTGLAPDVLCLIGGPTLHGPVAQPEVLHLGPNPTLVGRHYPLDLAATCGLKETLPALCEALVRLHDAETVAAWPRQREGVRRYAQQLIAREEALVREHERDTTVHPALLEAAMAELLPRHALMVVENPTGRTTLLPFGHEGMGYLRGGGGSLGWGVGGAIGAKIGAGPERPVVLNIGDGSLMYSAAGFWTMARYNVAVLTIVSNNGSYQVVRHNWARQMPTSRMVREARYPGLYLGDPTVDFVALARAQGVEGERVTAPAQLEAALRRGVERITRDNRPYLIDVVVAREGPGAASTWHQNWRL